MINSEPLDVLLERDEVGRTLAHQWAAEGKYKELRDLHARGIDLNIADRDGVTPVHRAAECNKWNVIQVLAQLDVDLSVRDICAQTPQHYGAWHNHKDVLRVLHELKANLDVQDEEGKTPAHYAARQGHCGVLRTLHKINENLLRVKDKDNLTPLHYATGDAATMFQIVNKDGRGTTPLRVPTPQRVAVSPRGETPQRGLSPARGGTPQRFTSPMKGVTFGDESSGRRGSGSTRINSMSSAPSDSYDDEFSPHRAGSPNSRPSQSNFGYHQRLPAVQEWYDETPNNAQRSSNYAQQSPNNSWAMKNPLQSGQRDRYSGNGMMSHSPRRQSNEKDWDRPDAYHQRVPEAPAVTWADGDTYEYDNSSPRSGRKIARTPYRRRD